MTKFIIVVIMWEIMWSWWWVKPLPSEKHFIRKEYSNIKENNNNNLIKNWLRASLKKRRHDTSRCKSANTTNNQNHKRSKDLQVKFLYESKSGKSLRQSGNYGDYVNPYFQKNINIGYVHTQIRIRILLKNCFMNCE